MLTPVNKSVPSDVARLFEERKRDIVDGKLKPFAGPLKDSTGVVRVAAGSTLSDAELLAINWYVDGIDASIPK